MGMLHGHAAWACRMGMLHGHAAMGMLHGYAALVCSIGMLHVHAVCMVFGVLHAARAMIYKGLFGFIFEFRLGSQSYS